MAGRIHSSRGGWGATQAARTAGVALAALAAAFAVPLHASDYYVATDGWFDRYVYQAVVRKAFLTDAERGELAREPKHLNLWAPMGTLAD